MKKENWTCFPLVQYSGAMDITLTPSTVQGRIIIPASKSQTIRALLIATLANGTSIIRNPLDSQDTRSCLEACRLLGADIVWDGERNIIHLDSSLVERNSDTPVTVDCGNSGTTLYLAVGMAAALGRNVRFTGDEQLCNRPIAPLLSSLEDLGATVVYDSERFGYPPFSIKGPLRGGKTSIECETSQYLSGLLLACSIAAGDSEIEIPLLHEKPYVGITLSWLDRQKIRYTGAKDLQHFIVPGGQRYVPFDEQITGDFSSAAFFFCAAAICGTTVTVDGLDQNDPQGDKHILDILARMGCTVSWEGHAATVTGPKIARLQGGTFDLNSMPDALPVLAVTACFACSEVRIVNVPQARIKETDRIAVMHENLTKLGAVVTEQPDGMTIQGSEGLRGGTVEGFDDHRVIMAMAIASLRCDGDLTIKGIEAAGVTFPTFFSILESLRR